MFNLFLVLTFFSIVLLTSCECIRSLFSKSKQIQKKIKKAQQYITLQDWSNAEKEWRLLSENNVKCKELALLEVQILRAKGEFKQALQSVEKNSRQFPEELLLRYEEGEILLSLARFEEALASFQVAAPILRSDKALFSVATALLKTGRQEQALSHIQPLLQTRQNGELFGLAGDIYFELRQFQEAIHYYHRALESDCKSRGLYLQLAHAYRRLGNLIEAENIFKSLLEKYPLDLEATLGWGACAEERGHFHKAFLIYSTQIEVEDFRLFYRAGYAALRTQKYRLAESYFLKLGDLQQPDAQIFIWLGFAYEKQKKWQEAEQIYSKLVELFPERPEGYRALAWMFGVGLSSTLSASLGLNYAHRALKLKNDLLSWEILSACAARHGEFDKAYQIQLALAKQDKTPKAATRRQQALRLLRKKTPLGDTQVLRAQVA